MHDRRLDQRDQRHVGISRHGDRSDQLRRQVVRHVDGGRAVSTADDADGCRLLRSEQAGGIRENECAVDSELGGCAEQQGDGVRDQRTEIRHRADCKEHHAGEEA